MANDEHIGRVINRNWRVVRKIGQGGMGTVWEVHHKDVRKLRRAVKQIRSNLSESQEVVRRFRREVNLMAALEGADHIVRVHEFDAEEGFGTFVVMDLIDGPSLAQIIKEKGALPYDQVLKFGRQIASALQLVHEIDVVHRDIKAPNVLIDVKRQKAFLTDFGIAKELAAAEGEQTVDGTTTGQIQYIGTPRYSSPEQLRVEYPPQSIWDIYSMGALLYEAYSGLQYLPQFRTYPEFLKNIGMDPAFRLQLAYPTPPPPSFAALVEHCLERDATRRLATAAELAAQLEECEQELRRRVVQSPAPAAPAAPAFEDQETHPEDFRTPRRDLRDEIERRFGALEEIEGTLVAVGLNLPAGPAAETLGHALRDISVIEGEGEYQEALGRLESLREQAAAAQARAEQAVREGVERRVADLDGERRALERDAGAWVDGAQLAAVEEGLAAARRALAEGHWKEIGDDLGALPERLHAAAAAAREAARAAAEQALAETSERLAAIEGLEAGAVPDGFDLAALHAQIEAHLEAGQLDAAAQQADAARAMLAAVYERSRERAGERLRAARTALERRLSSLDLEAARAAAPQEMAQLEAGRRVAAEAAAAGDLGAALAASVEAERAAGAAAARLAEVQAAERRALADVVRSLLAETAAAPDELLAEARSAAQAVLGQPPAAHAEAVGALRDAAARLTAARDEAPAFAAAVRGRDAATAARAAAAELTLPRAERRRAEARLADAARRFDARRWTEAATQYGDAQAEWESLAAAARARSQQEQCAALRAALHEELEGLAGLEAERAALAVPADDTPAVAELRAGLDPIAEQERGGALDAALAALGALRERAAGARAAHERALRGALEQAAAGLAARRADLDQRAGALLDPAERAALEQTAARAAAAAAEGAWSAARGGLAEARAALERSEAALRRDSGAAIAAQLAALEDDRRALAESGAAPGLDVDALRARTATLLEQGQFVAARQAAEAAAAELAAARAAAERELAERARGARAALEESLGGLNLEAARALAPRALERAQRLRDEATAAEQRRDYAAAIAAYQAAAEASARAAVEVDERQRRELGELAAAVREGLHALATVPAPLAEPARRAARAALEGADAADRATARAALLAARAALEQAQADAPPFAEAEARREAAEQARAGLAELQVTEQEQAAAQDAFAAGAAAVERRAWAEARDRFAAAEQGFTELVALGEERERARRALAAERAAARRELEGVIERAAGAPEAVIGPALVAAEAALGERDPAPQALRDAGAALAGALAEVPAYEEAGAARARVQALQQQLAARRLKRARFKPARAHLRAADEALTARQWGLAAQRYAEAGGDLAGLAELPDDASSRRAWIAAGVLIVSVVTGYVVVSRWPPPKPPLVEQPPAPAPVRIASVEPGAPSVRIDAGAAQPFAIELDPKTAKPAIEWKLDGAPLDAAKNQRAWTYTPDARAGDASHQLAVQVADGKADGQQRVWTLTVVGKPPPPPPPPVALTRIAAAQPAGDTVNVEEGAAQGFAIQLDPADATAPVQWSLAGKQVAAGPGLTAWDYRPDFKAAAGSPYELTAKVGDGTAPGQTRSWRVAVDDRNQVPQVVKAQPVQGQEVKKTIGQSASFAVEAKDADGDALRYQWTVDGKPAGGNRPTLEVPVERANETVALAISDGKQDQPLRLRWEISGAEAPFAMTAQPPSLRQLAFGGSQSFKLSPASGTAPAGIQIAWAVNGEKVADGPTYLYKATDPDSVGRAPVQVRATASDPTGKQFAKEWSFTVEPPPAPKITGASPPAGAVDAAPGSAQRLALSAAPPVGGQTFTYLFDVNGRRTSSTSPSVSVPAGDGQETTVVAMIEDNFKQRSKETRWTIRPAAKPPVAPPGDASAPVASWIEAYRSALNRKDVSKQCALLQLDAGKCAQLDKAVATQNDLKVAFDDVKISALPDGRASAQYTRVDEFVDPAGKTQTRSTRVTQTFRVVNGAAQLDKSGR